MIEFLHYLKKGPKLWELWYIPYYVKGNRLWELYMVYSLFWVGQDLDHQRYVSACRPSKASAENPRGSHRPEPEAF